MTVQILRSILAELPAEYDSLIVWVESGGEDYAPNVVRLERTIQGGSRPTHLTLASLLTGEGRTVLEIYTERRTPREIPDPR